MLNRLLSFLTRPSVALLKAGLLTTMLQSTAVLADIHFGGYTRFVMDEKNGRKSIKIGNDSGEPALVQVNIEWGNESAGRDLPIAVSKPLLLVPSRQSAFEEIIYQGKGLPVDRESYLMLTVAEIPKKPEGADSLQFAIRHHLKLFYRPQLSMDPQEAIDRLRWVRKRGAAVPSAQNDSPYYLTLTDIKLQDSAGKTCGETLRHWMLEPYSTQPLPSSGCATAPEGVSYVYISDSGFQHPRTFPLQSAP
ncbi:fimbrial biogenesis chaperone [Burkholderia cepacia]|uniref:fimbrial biogenesis chaperone n=1 Tax=Burkholderia cepacia TaxID=292 RepID=UPI00158BBA7F|nr:molecular chaperone [Burkholderia cepacia]